MPLSSLIRQLQSKSLTRELLERSSRADRLLIRGPSRPARAMVTSAISQLADCPVLVVVPTIEEASRWLALLEVMGWERALLYPTSESSPYEKFETTSEITWGQLQVLGDLIKNKSDKKTAIVASERCLQPHLPPKEIFNENCLEIYKGQQLDTHDLSRDLTSVGYKKLTTTNQEGTWSRRGDIVDIFPVNT